MYTQNEFINAIRKTKVYSNDTSPFKDFVTQVKGFNTHVLYSKQAYDELTKMLFEDDTFHSAMDALIKLKLELEVTRDNSVLSEDVYYEFYQSDMLDNFNYNYFDKRLKLGGDKKPSHDVLFELIVMINITDFYKL